MARYVEEPFGGAKRKFRLGIGELRDLQDATGVGPATLVARFIALPPAADHNKRPREDAYELGKADPDYIADFNVYASIRTFGGDWRVDDLRETIRLGLLGAGMTSTEADVLMMKHFDHPDAPGLHEHVGLAAQIVIHAIAPDKDDPAGKAPAETTPTAPATES
ncbi:MAG: gene transfer agent family protein [Candidatus Devosia phytovorans]|uniref:Gene transfer agent family protein n=1 Tax=Candidatus Devosia phytovorans TaxID=3121372 RepID=A0AAJ5VXB1_9HYPH|nr:gene transfer agent family protein [Devosia sp.]WEK05776.1 MAG: gene transfer agent family protein [Devosia sp.]